MYDDKFIEHEELLGKALHALGEMPVPTGPPQETADSVLTRLAQMTGEARSLNDSARTGIKELIRGMRLSSKLATATLLAAFVCAAALLAVMSRPKTLYAQIARATEKAKTFHLVQRESRNGRWYSDLEVWYDREAGVVEETRYASRTDVRIDNGQYEWRYSKGGDLVAKLKSYRARDEYLLDFIGGWLRFEPIRNSARDVMLKGENLRAYKLSERGDPEQECIWIDQADRVRQYEGDEVNNAGEEVQIRATAEYDVPIVPKRFSPDFGPDARVIASNELVQAQFPLGNAIFTKETMGMVYALHELKQCEGGTMYLVCSTRITDNTRSEIGTGHPWTHYGQSDLMARWQSWDVAGSIDIPLLLGRMKHDGVQVDWYLIVPRTADPADADRCDVDVTLNTANQLEEKCKAEGLKGRDMFRLNIKVPTSTKPELLLSDVASGLYALAARFEPIVHSFLLTEVRTKPNGDGAKMIWRKPAALSEKAFAQNVQKRVDRELSRIAKDAAHAQR